MKKSILILLAAVLFAFQNPFEENSTEKPKEINGIIIYNLPVIEENQTQKTAIIPISTNENNETNESNTTSLEINTTYEEIFVNSIKTLKPSVDVAIVIDKKLFNPYLLSIINSLNSYFIYKKVDFNLSVYDINETDEALKHKNIIYYTYNTNILNSLTPYTQNNFYFPLINKNDTEINTTNFYFGGIDYISQLNKLSELIEQNNIIAINDGTLTSQKLYSLESQFFEVTPMGFHEINYEDLNNSYLFLNTSPQKSVQILSDLYYKNINPKLILSTQINYSPILIALTQKEALNKLIVANSIINPPLELTDINRLLASDIKFNWLNYSASVLCNDIYNKFSEGDQYFMNDFSLYIFNNQINFKTKLYQVVFKAFKEIYFLP